MCMHALHTVHALPDLRVAGGRLGDGVSLERAHLGEAVRGRALDLVSANHLSVPSGRNRDSLLRFPRTHE